MSDFHFELVSPEKLIFSGQVSEVTVPGREGEFGVLAHHAPFVSVLKAGLLTIRTGADVQKLVVRGGFAEVGPDGLTVLAEFAIPASQLHLDDVIAQIKSAQEDVADAKTEAQRARALDQLEKLQQIRGVISAI